MAQGEDRLHPRPGDQRPREDPRAGRRRHGRRPAQHEPRQPRRPRARLPAGPRGGRRHRARGRRSSPTCRARRSGWTRSPTARPSSSDGASVHDHHPRRRRATPTICGTTYDGLPGDVGRRRPDPHRRRQDPAPGDRGRRRRRPHRGRRRRHRSATTRASTCPASPSACRRCRRRTIEDLRWALQLSVDFIALSFVRSRQRRRGGARDHARGGRPRCPSSPRSRSRRRSTTSTR